MSHREFSTFLKGSCTKWTPSRPPANCIWWTNQPQFLPGWPVISDCFNQNAENFCCLHVNTKPVCSSSDTLQFQLEFLVPLCSCFFLTYPRMQTGENSKKRHLCVRCLIREKIALQQIHQRWMYVTASPAQNQNSSFVCHFPMLLAGKKDSTLTGRELASPFEAGKWPLTW